MDAFLLDFALEGLHLFGHLDFGDFSLLLIVVLTLAGLLSPDRFLLLANGLVPGNGGSLLSLEGLVETPLVILFNLAVVAVMGLRLIVVAVVPVLLSEVVLRNDTEIIAH